MAKLVLFLVLILFIPVVRPASANDWALLLDDSRLRSEVNILSITPLEASRENPNSLVIEAWSRISYAAVQEFNGDVFYDSTLSLIRYYCSERKFEIRETLLYSKGSVVYSSKALWEKENIVPNSLIESNYRYLCNAGYVPERRTKR